MEGRKPAPLDYAGNHSSTDTQPVTVSRFFTLIQVLLISFAVSIIVVVFTIVGVILLVAAFGSLSGFKVWLD